MAVPILWGTFLISALLAFASYMRITVILRALDKLMEEPPVRPHLQDKLRSYRDWCSEQGKYPVLLLLFALGAIGMVLAWTPLPWFIYK
jgi:hypothetical protein